MPLVVRLRKLAFLTVCGPISVGGRTGANFYLIVTVTVRRISVSLSNVFRLARQQNWSLDIPVFWVMLTVLSSLLSLRRLCGVNFLVLKLCGALMRLSMMQLLLLFGGILLTAMPVSPWTSLLKALPVVRVRVAVLPMDVVSLLAWVSSVPSLLFADWGTRFDKVPRLVCVVLDDVTSWCWRLLVVTRLLMRDIDLLWVVRSWWTWLGLACRSPGLTMRESALLGCWVIFLSAGDRVVRDARLGLCRRCRRRLCRRLLFGLCRCLVLECLL